ncbi:hypothetical protein F383_18757 [Gossypium arboreum]|uniref:Uncharacterized protein n=2 Tax=Gossypium arboreum TaxID=29729 RepID=A0A0B0NQ74_GOSAR|nr:hypothetical protein F383_18757 [Gossypium arboreum]
MVKSLFFGWHTLLSMTVLCSTLSGDHCSKLD